MAIDFANLTAKKTGAASGKGAEELPRANFWLNIGYAVEVPTEDGKGTEERFVSLPQGIALDTQEHVSTKGKKVEWKQFQSARNELLDALLDKAATLEPGEDVIVNLQIQLRRVNDEDESVVDKDTNPFSIKNINL